MRRPIGIGVIGFGWMGQAHSRSYLRLPTLFEDRPTSLASSCARTTSPCDGSRPWSPSASRRPRTTGGTSSTATMSTSSSSPRRTCCTRSSAWQRRRPASTLFCEKPVGGTPEQTVRIAAAARRPAIITGVGYNYRWAPLVLHTRELIESGRLGRADELPRTVLLHVRQRPDGAARRGASWRPRAATACRATSSAMPWTWPTCSSGPIARVVGTKETLHPPAPTAAAGGPGTTPSASRRTRRAR